MAASDDTDDGVDAAAGSDNSSCAAGRQEGGRGDHTVTFILPTVENSNAAALKSSPAAWWNLTAALRASPAFTSAAPAAANPR